MVWTTSDRSCSTRPWLQMSRLPTSTKVPAASSIASDAETIPGDVNELMTLSTTPRSSTKAVDLESPTAATRIRRSTDRLVGVLAVERHSQPRATAMLTVAIPRPPEPA